MPPGPILVVSGPAGVGKSTTSVLVAAAFASSVHLQADDFTYAIVQGRVPSWLPEAAHQHEVTGAAVAVAAMQYAEGGYSVILDGHLFPEGVAGLAAACTGRGIAVHYTVLHADLGTCLARANGRGDAWGREPTPLAEMQGPMADLHARFDGIDPAHVVDATAPPEEVAAAVLTAYGSGRLAVQR